MLVPLAKKTKNTPNLVKLRRIIASKEFFYLDVNKPYTIGHKKYDPSLSFLGPEYEVMVKGVIHEGSFIVPKGTVYIRTTERAELEERIRVAKESKKFDDKIETLLND